MVIEVSLDNGEVLRQEITKTTSGNGELLHEVTIDVPHEHKGASIASVKVSTEGPGNWELRYLETELKDESFDYRVLDSDGNFSEEAQVDIKIADNKPPIAIDDPTSFEVRLGTFNTDNNLRWSDDGVAKISTRYGIDEISDNVNENTLKQGASNDVSGGPAAQIQYNSENGKSEEFVIELNGYVDNFSFSVSNLFLNEGGSNSHEQGRWTTYNGNNVVDTGVFIANDGSNKGIYHIEDLSGSFNKIVFDAVEYTGGVPKGSDSSDYFITGFRVSSTSEYSGFEGQVISISIAELLSNDYDPDGDDIRLTHVSEVSDGAIAWIDGDYVKVQLPEGVDEISFKYQITDDKGLVSSSELIEATVKVAVNAVEIRQQGDTVISYHDSNQVEYKESNSKNWEHIKADDVKFLEGSTGKWGTESNNFEVGDHAVYRAKDPDGDKQKVLELEAHKGDNDLYTEFSAEQGQFLTLSFDVVARRLHDSPMKITLQDTQGNQIGADIYTYQPSKEWKAESISFQIPSDASYDGDYRIVFESSETDSYGALLDNIELKTLNNVGFEAQSFPLADITFSTDLHAGITNDDLEVRVRLNDLPSDSKFILGEQSFTDLDQDGWVELGTLTDLSNLRLEVGEEGSYHFTVEVLHQNDVVAKSDDIEVNVLDASLSPLASGVQIATNGDDLLEATTDSDILVGLDGSDTFSWDFEALSSVNADTIKDFELREDIIDLSELFSSGETMDDILSSVVSDDGDVILTVDASKGASSASQEIRLEGVAEQANYLDANAGEISGDQLSRLLNDITNTTP
ncbi:T1SS secreted agglutinin RTX [Vibrio ponticus]|nr:T1SS secreted agglutinin RTX [Vibrio ponticus]